MPSPTTALATLRPDLAQSFQQFDLLADQAGFIGYRVIPPIDVQRQAGVFGKIGIEQLLQNRQTNRATLAGYNRSRWQFTNDSYTCQEYGAEEVIDDREENMYANYFEAEQVAAARALDVVLRNGEVRVAAAIINTAVWTGASLTTAVGVPWSTPATAVPLTDIEGAVQKVYTNSGIWPNAIVLSRKNFRNLRNVVQIVDRIKYAGFQDPRAGNITVEAMAQAFDLKYVIVAGSTKNTANEAQAASLSSIWDDTKAMVCRVAETNDIREPCIGRTFHYTEDGSTIGGTMESYRDETVRADVIRVRNDVHEKILYVQMGHLLTGT
jgi:hypothetical protein